MTYVQLFFSFLLVGLFSVGGGYAAIPLIQAQVVEAHGWLTMAEFTNLVTIAEMTPGPIAVNSATFVGIRIAGVPGAVVATLGCIFPALILVSVLAYLYRRYQSAPALDSVLSCLRPAVVALIAAAGLAMLGTAVLGGAAPAPGNVQWASAALFCAALVLLRWRKWNPILVMCLCGAPSAKRSASAAPVPACEAQNRKKALAFPFGKASAFLRLFSAPGAWPEALPCGAPPRFPACLCGCAARPPARLCAKAYPALRPHRHTARPPG